MKTMTLLLLILTTASFAELEPLSDEAMSEQNLSALPPWINSNDGLVSSINTPEDFMSITELSEVLRNSAVAGIPEELNIAIDFQDFIAGLTDPTKDLNYMGQIIAEVLRRAGLSFDLTFDKIVTREHFKMILVDNNGNELFSSFLPDLVSFRLENLRVGDTETSIGNIYITNWDFARGSNLRIQVRE